MKSAIVKDLKAKLEVEILEETEDKITGYSRYWGDWEFDDDDEEDCDSEILTDDSYDKLVEIIKSLNEKYKDYKFDYEFSEKNYIDFTVIKR